MRRSLILLVFSSALGGYGCASREDGAARDVAQFGTMREVLREGRSEARVGLAAVLGSPGAVAVGALAGLDGEVTVADGEAWVAQVREGRLEVRPARPEDQATLLTVAQVDRWARLDLHGADDLPALEDAVATWADELGLEASKPFPFIVDGTAASVELHVIAGACPMAGPADQGEGHAPHRLSIEGPIPVRLAGFYADDREGEMTHHGSRIHLHAILGRDAPPITGHLDDVELTAGATLRLPAPPVGTRQALQ